MMLAFKTNAADAELIVAAYVAAMDDLPPWAVEEASSRFARGRIQDRNNAFAPTSAELHIVARQVIAEEYAKEHKLSDLMHERKYYTDRVDRERCTPEQNEYCDTRLRQLEQEIAAATEALRAFPDQAGRA